MRFLSYLILESLNDVIYNISMYTLCNEWIELNKLRSQRHCYSLVFDTLPESVTRARNTAGPRPLQIAAMVFDEDENKVMRLESQLGLTLEIESGHCCSRRLDRPNLNLVWNGLDLRRKHDFYVQSAEEEENNGSLKETGAGAGGVVYDMKKEDIVDQSEPTAFSTLTKQGMTAM